MPESLKKLGMAGLLSLSSLLLMLVSLLSGFSHVLASNDCDEKSKATAQLIQATAQAAGVSSVQSNLPVQSKNNSAETARIDEREAQRRTKPNYQRFRLVDEQGKSIYPSALLQVDKHIYLLAAECMYLLADLAGNAQEERPLVAQTIDIPGKKVKGIPIQEFLSFTFWPAHKSLVVLDKSGSLFEYNVKTNKWQLLFANQRKLGSPDPHYVSISSDGPHLLLLDPERNQIWRFPASAQGERYFRDVLPWRIKAGDPNVSDGIGIAYDGSTYVLRRSGTISIYPANSHGGNGNPRRLAYKQPAAMTPSRFAVSSSAAAPIYIIERENCRVLAIDKNKGTVQQFFFPHESDLRGLLPGYGGFCVIDGDHLAFRMLQETTSQTRPTGRVLDRRLNILNIPIKNSSLPRHPGVFPGARRLYRHGVHQGLDFFHDPGCGTHVAVNTPAIAAACGKVIRADTNYHDMTAGQYNKIMSECAASQYCSDANEDLFRGCQVWIDHGNGLITRYAHLNKARPDLRVGMPINAGDTIGFIGYSGTGENQPGKGKHPHLHFEIWLDGHYLGYGLTPAETISLYQKLFSSNAKRGH